MTTYVKVPVRHLKQLEEARVKLYELFPDATTEQLCRLEAISRPMWLLAHKQYEEIKSNE